MSRDFNRFDWVEALLSAPALKNKPGAIRVGVALGVHYFNEEKGVAWPSRAELARKVNSSPESVSAWLTELRKSGAIRTSSQGSDDITTRFHKARSGKRFSDPRSLFYTLDFDWAVRVLNAKSSDEGLRGTRPPASGRVVKTTTERVVKTTTEIGSDLHDTEPLTSNQREPDTSTGRPERDQERRAAS